MTQQNYAGAPSLRALNFDAESMSDIVATAEKLINGETKTEVAPVTEPVKSALLSETQPVESVEITPDPEVDDGDDDDSAYGNFQKISNDKSRMIPKERLDKVIGQREKAKKKSQVLEETVAQLTQLVRETVTARNEPKIDTSGYEDPDENTQLAELLAKKGLVSRDEVENLVNERLNSMISKQKEEEEVNATIKGWEDFVIANNADKRLPKIDKEKDLARYAREAQESGIYNWAVVHERLNQVAFETLRIEKYKKKSTHVETRAVETGNQKSGANRKEHVRSPSLSGMDLISPDYIAELTAEASSLLK